MLNRLPRTLALGTGLLALGACGGENTDPTEPGPGQPTVDRVKVAPGADTASAVGDTVEYEAIALTSDGDTITGTSVSWSSTDTSVATVDGQGTAEALANGTTEIQATTEAVTDSATLTVDQRASSVSLRPDTIILTAFDDTVRFTAKATDANGNPVSNAQFIWRSEIDSIASVDSSGLATAHHEGKTSISATTEGVTGKAVLKVDQPGERLSFLTGPTDVEAQETISPGVQVEVVDSTGSRATSWSGTVTISLAADPTAEYGYSGEAPLHGTKVVNVSDGVAIFSDLSLVRPGDGFTLEAKATALVADTSQGFNVSLTFGHVSVGGGHTCGVTTTDHLYCWGYNDYGQVGDGSTTNRFAPAAVDVSELSTQTFATVSAGSSHTCGITTNDALYCWGINNYGQLGDATTTNRLTPVAVDVSGLSIQRFTRVSAGGSHTCAVATDDRLFCWGVDGDGQLGDGGIKADRHTPVAVNVSQLTTQTFAQVSAGGDHTCGVTTSDSIYCWGNNRFGQLGDDTETEHLSPTAVDVSGLSTKTFASTAAGSSHSCGVTTTGVAYCWGWNGRGQLGGGTTTNRSTPAPVDVSGLSTQTFTTLTTLFHTTCGLTTAAEPYCWGDNKYGQIGDGTTTNRSAPTAVDVSALSTGSFKLITAGVQHTCGLTTADEAFCWGFNQGGNLGNGTITDSWTPVSVIQ